MRERLGGLILVIASASLPGVSAAQEVEVGVTAAVNPTTSGFSRTYGERTLVIGHDIVFGERITTTEQAQAQILFIDESSLTVGPGSDLVIDAFVFDPATSSGELAASLGKGVFRYVGGRISKTTPVVLRTPTAALGIRGGVGLLRVDRDNGATTAIFVYGDELRIDSVGGGTVRLRRPGFKVTVLPDGAFTAVEPATPDEIADALGELEGTEGQSGGATEQPTNERIAETAIVVLGSGVDPAVIRESAPSPGDAGRLTLPEDSDEATRSTEASHDVASEGTQFGNGIDLGLIGDFFGLADLGFLELPDAGTASLVGFAAGTVDDNGTLRDAIGDFSMSVNFASRSGSVAISNFDGRAFGGAVSDTGAGNDFFGTFSGTLADTDGQGPLTGPTEGIVFRFDDGGPVTAAVGSFSVDNGGSYKIDGAYIGTDN